MTNAVESLLDVTNYVAGLQRDGRLLLRHIARRSDYALPDDVPAGMTTDGGPSGALFADPNEVVKTPAALAELVNTLDGLSRRAAPANVRSIRLTSAYLEIAVEGKEPPPDIKSEAVRVQWRMRTIFAITGTVFIGSVILLSHIDGGRRLLQQLSVLQQQETDIKTALGALPLTESVVQPGNAAPALENGAQGGGAAEGNADAALQLCRPAEPDGRWRRPITHNAAKLCGQDADVRVRLALLYMSLADWNCTIYHFAHPWMALQGDGDCGHPSEELAPGIDLRAWRSHETRVTATTAVVAGFVLPMMLGCLGGCAYALRRLDRKLQDWTLEPRDGTHALVRVGLAALLGGLVGLVWTSDESVKLGAFTLSLAALAFFIGFAVEAAFKVIESLIDTVTAGVKTPLNRPQQTAMTPADVRRIAAQVPTGNFGNATSGVPPAAGADKASENNPPPPEAAATEPGTRQAVAVTDVVVVPASSPVADVSGTGDASSKPWTGLARARAT